MVLDVGQEDQGVVWALGERPVGSAPQAILGGGRWPSPHLARGSPQYLGFRA